jgi:hypothetical protein
MSIYKILLMEIFPNLDWLLTSDQIVRYYYLKDSEMPVQVALIDH